MCVCVCVWGGGGGGPPLYIRHCNLDHVLGVELTQSLLQSLFVLVMCLGYFIISSSTTIVAQSGSKRGRENLVSTASTSAMCGGSQERNRDQQL